MDWIPKAILSRYAKTDLWCAEIMHKLLFHDFKYSKTQRFSGLLIRKYSCTKCGHPLDIYPESSWLREDDHISIGARWYNEDSCEEIIMDRILK